MIHIHTPYFLAIKSAYPVKERVALPSRCLVTKNPVGTDTWAAGHPCECAPCQAYLRRLAEHCFDPYTDDCVYCHIARWMLPEYPELANSCSARRTSKEAKPDPDRFWKAVRDVARGT